MSLCLTVSLRSFPIGLRGDAGGKGVPLVGVGARSIRLKSRAEGLDEGPDASGICTPLSCRGVVLPVTIRKSFTKLVMKLV